MSRLRLAAKIWPNRLWPGRFWPDRIATRIAVIMIAAMLLTQVFGYLLFLSDRNGWWPQSSLDAAIERLRGPLETVLRTPPGQRAETVAAFQRDGVALSLRSTFDPVDLLRSAPPVDRLRDHFLRRLPHLIDQVVVEARVPELEHGPPLLGFAPPPDGTVILWLRLADGTWATATLPLSDLLPPRVLFPWLPWGVALLTILAISLVAARGISRSLRRLAAAAEQFGINIGSVALAEAGPREIRSVTRSFNQMQARLKRFVADRTQMLASISHDLRTPLSRLRLRAEALPAGPEKQKMLADLELMDRMIAATLSFARDDVAGEARVKVDLASLVQAICDETVDAGSEARYEGPDYLVIEAAPLALTRAITNVIENAVKYGFRAAVAVLETPDSVEIAIRDAGPGIPPAEQERVFEPFYRLDPARSPDSAAGATGGTGLGLAIARHVLRAHGGDVFLHNGADVGLVVRLVLPRIAP